MKCILCNHTSKFLDNYKFSLDTDKEYFGNLKIHLCDECNLGFANPMPTLSKLNEFYKNIYKDFNMNKKICTLFGCGGDRDKSKRKMTSKIVDQYSSKIIITEDNSRTEQFKKILNDILKGIKNLDKVQIIRSRKKAIRYMLHISSKDQLNFILGKGNEDYILENNRKIKHNDVVYLENILKKKILTLMILMIQ